jgi:arabinose-5-phosphate isomerase
LQKTKQIKQEAALMIENVKKEFETFLSTSLAELTNLTEKLSIEAYAPAVRLILDAEAAGGRVHVTGIGKPGHIAGYIASLLSSTGTPAYELHGTEAVHGSSGQVCPGDVVIAISNSGETAELKATVNTVKMLWKLKHCLYS